MTLLLTHHDNSGPRHFSWAWLHRFILIIPLLITFMTVTTPTRSEIRTFEAELHFIFYFYPKYEYRNCMVSVGYVEEAGSWVDMNRTFFETLGSYLLSDEPAAAGFTFRGSGEPNDYTYLVDFTDECPRREEIMSVFISKLSDEFPTVKFRIIDLHPDIPDGQPGTDSWIDSETYNPENWQRKMDAAGSCEPGVWSKLAEYHRHKGDSFDEYFDYAYSLTAAHLSNRTEVKIKKIKARPSSLAAPQKVKVDNLVSAYLKQANCF